MGHTYARIASIDTAARNAMPTVGRVFGVLPTSPIVAV